MDPSHKAVSIRFSELVPRKLRRYPPRFVVTLESTGLSTPSTNGVRPVALPALASTYVISEFSLCLLKINILFCSESWSGQRSPPQPYSCPLHLEETQHAQLAPISLIVLPLSKSLCSFTSLVFFLLFVSSLKQERHYVALIPRGFTNQSY